MHPGPASPSAVPPTAPAALRGADAGVTSGRRGTRGAGAGAHGSPAHPGDPGHAAVEVRRSHRRRRTVTAYRQEGRTIVLIPASFSAAEERRWVAQMVAKLETREDRRRRTLGSDEDLMARARVLSQAHLGGVLPASVRWVDNQNRRWGSCTPADRTIRLSSRLRGMPEYVVDYVLVHELAHLLEPAHDDAFWALVGRYPRAERALGFLEGVESRLGAAPADGDDTD
ncbi:M48 family metallopeptidase [Modestobacter sp. Leaf380]|uniref:M48 metallopeptidase family protein n=1 Tax=Modestobacter sp. Leaf380 TaxID=1736356 RepID=UPI001F405B13|nr:M48 family metallopeptidase [Modestobacter sp. Leaf380]